MREKKGDYIKLVTPAIIKSNCSESVMRVSLSVVRECVEPLEIRAERSDGTKETLCCAACENFHASHFRVFQRDTAAARANRTSLIMRRSYVLALRLCVCANRHFDFKSRR